MPVDLARVAEMTPEEFSTRRMRIRASIHKVVLLKPMSSGPKGIKVKVSADTTMGRQRLPATVTPNKTLKNDEAEGKPSATFDSDSIGPGIKGVKMPEWQQKLSDVDLLTKKLQLKVTIRDDEVLGVVYILIYFCRHNRVIYLPLVSVEKSSWLIFVRSADFERHHRFSRPVYYHAGVNSPPLFNN